MLRAKQNLGSTNSWRILVLPKAVLQRDAVAHVATPLRCDARRAVGVGSEVGAEPVQEWGAGPDDLTVPAELPDRTDDANSVEPAADSVSWLTIKMILIFISINILLSCLYSYCSIIILWMQGPACRLSNQHLLPTPTWIQRLSWKPSTGQILTCVMTLN